MNLRRFLLVAALLLGGCATRPGVDHRQTLLLWGAASDDHGFQALVRTFEAEHPGVRVKMLSMGAGGMNPQKLMTSIVGNVPPDVILQERFTVNDWASRNAFRPLDDLIARDAKKDPNAPAQDRYYPAGWDEATYQGRQYAIPYDVDARALFWNKKVFRAFADQLREAGLDPNRPPRTWSELLAYTKVLTVFGPDGRPKQIGFAPNYGNSWLDMYAFMTNSHFLSKDGRTCTLDTPEAEEALTFIKNGYDLIGGYQNATEFSQGGMGKDQDQFLAGQFAMKIDGNWILNDILRFGPGAEFGVAPAPVPDDRLAKRGHYKDEKDPYITWTGGNCLVIPTGSRHVETAWDFIKFAASARGWMIATHENAAWARNEGRAFIPIMPANIDANRQVFSQYMPGDPRFKAAFETLRSLMPVARTRPPTFAGQILWDEQQKALANACQGQMSVHQALLSGQAVVQRELDAEFEAYKHPEVNLDPRWWLLPLALLLGFKLVWVWKVQGMKRLARSEAWAGGLFIAPWVFGFLTLTLGPMIASAVFSFTRYNVLSPPRWIGFENYTVMAGADWSNISKAFVNVAWLAGFGVPLSIVSGLAVAMLLNASMRGIGVYRTAFYMPSMVPAVASTVLWAWILKPNPQMGLLNAAWNHTLTPWLHIPPPGWVDAPDWAKPALVIMGLWGVGSGMVLWLAGLKGISRTLYEASSLDGAGPTRQFWAVTFPQLSPVIFFNVVVGFVGALQEFDRAYILTAGETFGPQDSLLTPVFYLFRNGFGYFRMGYASALAWAIFAIILLLTGIQFGMSRLWVYYEAER